LVDASFDPDTHTGRILLRPNRSWSWRANLYLLGTLVVASSAVPLVLATHGFWLALPFSVAELAAVFVALYICVRRTHRQEVIRLSPSELVIEAGHQQLERMLCYERFHTRILVHAPRHRWDRARVAVRCRGDETEVGSFLTQIERHALVQDMRDMIAELNRMPCSVDDHGAPVARADTTLLDHALRLRRRPGQRA
jgi:uncharacterized membrane protein